MLDYSRFFKGISDLFISILLWTVFAACIAIAFLALFAPEFLIQVLEYLNIPCQTESCERFLNRKS